jgi:two-component system phosphate regulon response regulator PhoB
MAGKPILVVDDEEDIRELVRYNLERAGYDCLCAESGTEALEQIQKELPGLVLLDLMLPGLDGFEVCAMLKSDPRTAGVAIVMLTARGSERDIVRGLELGADDYVTKPFSPKVLVARVGAVLRRQAPEGEGDSAPIRAGELVLRPDQRGVTLEGTALELTRSEFDLLALLARRPGRVFTRAQVVDALHGPGYPVTDRSVDVHVVSLRKKLGTHGDRIETVRGVGYRFRE